MKSKKELKQAATIENANIFAWYSTYGHLTVERLFAIFKLNVDNRVLKIALNNPYSFYFQLLRIPYNNILNTLIADQAHEYQTFAQKIFVDYLLSGQADQPDGTPGDHARQAIETKRLELLRAIEKFSHEQNSQRRFIAQSQAKLIKTTKSINQEVSKLVTHEVFLAEGIDEKKAKLIIDILLSFQIANQTVDEAAFKKITELTKLNMSERLHSELTSLVTPLLRFADELPVNMSLELDQVQYFNNIFRDFRTDFYNIIISTNELINTLPDYRKIHDKETKNMEFLNFDNIE